MKSLDNEDILYSDNHLLVAMKPANLLTQPSPQCEDSLEKHLKVWVKKEYQKKGNVFLHVIHRLDRCVSGLVIFARTSKALGRLNEQSRNMEIQRVYVAEVEGEMKESEGQLDHFLVHGDRKAIVSKEGNKDAKHARLFFEVLHRSGGVSTVRVTLETGRYHQIRAQFGAIGHPVVGDVKYGGKSGDGKVIHLHCAEVSFTHPVTKEVLKLEAAAPFGL